MNKTTTVLYYSTQAPYQCYRLDDDGQLIERQQLDALSDITLDNASRLIVLIPGENVLLTQVQLPAKTSRSQWRQAIPYVLEEQLASDVEDCFFAFGQADEQGNIPVAVIQRQQFETILQALREAGLHADIILPDFLALPFEALTWMLHVRDNLVSVRTDRAAGFSIDCDNLTEMLFLQKEKPGRLVFLGDTQLDLDEAFVVEQAALRLDVNPPINLLQGPYRSKHRRTKSSNRWRQCIYAVAAVVLALFVSNIVQYFFYQHQSSQLQQAIAANYRRIFPGAKEVLEPRFRIKALLKSLGHTATANHFLRMSNVLGASLQKQPAVQIITLQYQHQTLMVQLLARKISQLDAVITALSKQGLRVQQDQIQAKKTQATAKLRIQETVT